MFMSDTSLICVFYNPSKECLSKWKAFSDEFKECIFVDNSSTDNSQIGLPNYIFLGSNLGIAKAQNIGINRAKQLGVEYIVFFDQDSSVNINLIYGLKSEFESLKSKGINVGAIGPSLIEENTGERYKGSNSGSIYPKKVNTLISSGTLMQLSTLDDVGGLNERLFIDLVDHEWCWRANSKGYQLFMSSQNILRHQVGKRTVHLGKFPIIISASIRYYYQYRNTIWLFKCKYAPTKWKRKALIRKTIEMIILPFVVNHPIKIIKNIFNGILDGIFKKL